MPFSIWLQIPPTCLWHCLLLASVPSQWQIWPAQCFCSWHCVPSQLVLDHQRPQARHEPFPWAGCFLIQLVGRAVQPLGPNQEKHSLVSMSPLRKDHRISCCLYSGTVNLDQGLLSPSSVDIHFACPSPLLVWYHDFPLFSSHKVLAELTHTYSSISPGQPEQHNTPRISDWCRDVPMTQAGPVTVLPEEDRDAFCQGY